VQPEPQEWEAPSGFPVDVRVRDFIDEDSAKAHNRYAEEVAKNPLELQSWTLTYLVDIFNVHAHHHLPLICTADQARQVYEPYLKALSNNVISHGEHMMARWPVLMNAHVLILSLRGHLVGRISHWKAEALRQARNKQEPGIVSGIKAGEGTIKTGASKTPRISSVIESHIAAERMTDFIRKHNLSLSEFARRAGPGETTLRGFRRTKRARRDILKQIADAMGVNLADLINE
jgi:hypothetical protein